MVYLYRRITVESTTETKGKKMKVKLIIAVCVVKLVYFAVIAITMMKAF